MDMYVWMTGALLASTCAVCGTMYVTEKMRAKALKEYDFRKEEEYRKVEDRCDKWYQAYECEHGQRVQAEALCNVQKIIISHSEWKGETK